jgi:hypothetical protein
MRCATRRYGQSPGKSAPVGAKCWSADGVVTFGKVDPSQPMQVRFEWYSENFNITAHPIVFQVTP